MNRSEPTGGAPRDGEVLRVPTPHARGKMAPPSDLHAESNKNNPPQFTSKPSSTSPPLTPSPLTGIPTAGVAGNKRGLLVPNTTTDQELQHLRNALPEKVVIQRVEERLSALGNCIVTNDHVALVHTDLDRVRARPGPFAVVPTGGFEDEQTRPISPPSTLVGWLGCCERAPLDPVSTRDASVGDERTDAPVADLSPPVCPRSRPTVPERARVTRALDKRRKAYFPPCR